MLCLCDFNRRGGGRKRGEAVLYSDVPIRRFDACAAVRGHDTCLSTDQGAIASRKRGCVKRPECLRSKHPNQHAAKCDQPFTTRIQTPKHNPFFRLLASSISPSEVSGVFTVPATIPARSCKFDAKTFVPKRRDQLFCSKACRRAEVKRQYHAAKFSDGASKRARYDARKLLQGLATHGVKADAYAAAIAALKEAEEQSKAWTARIAARRSALQKLARPEGVELVARVLVGGEPPGPAIDRADRVGVASTDGLVAVVVFGRKV
jgi:hypothetical protein